MDIIEKREAHMTQQQPAAAGQPVLTIRDLWVAVEGKDIIKGLDLEVSKGEVHAIMGPNGSGKSTLSNTIMGHPRYDVKRGEILFKGESILELAPDERARRGLF